MATQGCYRDVLQWHNVGTTKEGCKILYKQYFSVLDDFVHQAQYDISLNKSFKASCKLGYVIVIDVQHVRKLKNAVSYIRYINNLADEKDNPVQVYVINTSKIVRFLWKVVRKFLDSKSAALVNFEHVEDAAFSCIEHLQKYNDLCKTQPINKS